MGAAGDDAPGRIIGRNPRVGAGQAHRDVSGRVLTHHEEVSPTIEPCEVLSNKRPVGAETRFAGEIERESSAGEGETSASRSIPTGALIVFRAGRQSDPEKACCTETLAGLGEELASAAEAFFRGECARLGFHDPH